VLNFIQQSLNGITYAGLLFLLGSGFTLIFGLMRIVNLTHGATYLLGGYFGYVTIQATHNFVLALIAGMATMAVFGVVLERGLLRSLRGQPIPELLLTMGVAFVMGDVALAVFGGNPVSVHMPGILDQSSQLGRITYPNSRFLILGVAVLVALMLYLLLGRTRALVLAGLDRPLSTTALAALIELSAAGASRHLLSLRDAGLVSTTRHGHEVRYSRTALGSALLNGRRA
jgi:branched-chain amino acid transport system permease protein